MQTFSKSLITPDHSHIDNPRHLFNINARVMYSNYSPKRIECFTDKHTALIAIDVSSEMRSTKALVVAKDGKKFTLYVIMKRKCCL